MSQFWFRDKLPFPWTYGVTRDGRVFFIDEEKRRTTWLHPTYGCAVQSGYISHPSLPEDWEMSMSDTGLLYYINHVDCTTTFHHPSEQMNEQTTASEFISPALANQTSIKRKASQSKTSGRPPEAKRDFSAPIVLDGWLHRQESGIMKPWKKRWCVLSNLCLYCYEGENDVQCISSIILPGYRINSCRKSDPVTRKYAFKVEHRNTKTCYFAAEDEIEMNRWIEVLRSAATLQKGDPSIEQYPSTPGSLQRYSTQQLADSYQEKENAWQGNVGRDVENDDAFWGRQNSRPDWESSMSNQNGISRPMDPDYPNVVLRQKTRNTDFPQTGQPSTYNFGNPLDAVDPVSSSTPMNDPRRIDWEFQDRRFSTQQMLPDRQPANFNDDYSNMQNRQNVGANQIHSSNQFIGLNSQHSVSSSRVNNELQRSFNQENNFRRQSASTGKLNDESQQYGSTRPAHNHPHIRQSYNYLNDNYSHEPHHRQMDSIHQDRVISPTGFQSTMGSFPGNQVMNNNKNELESPPERPPIPASLRDQYIDVLAETKTPKSRLDLFQSKEISHQKLTEPTYFQYPESPPTSQSTDRTGFGGMVDGRALPKQADLQQTPTGSKQFGLDQSGSNPRIRQIFQSGSNPQLSTNEGRIPDSQSRVASLGMHGNPTYLRILQNSANDSNRHSEQLNRLNSENEISKTMDEMTSGRKNPRQEFSDGPSSYSSKEFAPEPVLFNGPDAVRYAMSPGRRKENPVMAVNPIASRGIETIKEDPDMLDTDILTSRTLQDLQKHMAVHTRLRLSISVQDLVGKSHEELVLLLIQLRRSQTKLEEICKWAKSRLKEFQSQDQLNSQNSFSRTSDSINFPEMRKQVEELEKQIDVTQPLINLLDNMVTMGSLYNGDNLMYASQYKKNQLHPSQIVPEKKMIEFSRRHQEEQLTSKQESSMRQLTDDEINLEEKLKRLYELDGKLQETSCAVTSLQEDKAMLEKSLTGIRKSEDDEVNVVMLDRLQRQRQILEMELTRVLKELADASKLFEETNAENVKVEQQVITLRNKVYSISRSQSSPSLASGSGHVIVKLEQELKQIQSVMEGLSTQGSKISEEIGNLKAPNSSGVVSTLQVKPSTYIETDLDSRVSRDISRPSLDRPDGVTMNQQVSSSSSFSAIANRYVTGASPARNSSTKLEYKLAPTNGQSRSFGKDWNSSSSPSHGARSTGSMQSIPTNRTYSASIPAAHHGNNIAHSATNLTDITNGDDLMKRYYGILPKERSRSSVRDVKKREISRKAQAAGNYEIPNESSDARYSVLQRSRSLPRVSSGSNRESDYPGRRSTDDNNIQKSSVHTNLSRDDPSRSSAMQRLFPKQPSVGLQSNDSRNSSVSSRSRPTVSLSPMYSGSLPKFSSSVSPSVKTEVPKFVTVATVKPVPNTEVQRPSFTGHASESDRLSGFSNSWQSDSLGNNREVVKSEVVMDLNFDDNTIERAVFQPPQLVEIPARYVPDPRNENALTWEEKLQRKEKSDQIKKMLAVHSLQDYRQNELTSQTGTMREQVEAEKRQREEMLDIKQSLAEEVTQRSKQAALYRQQNMWSNTDSYGSLS